MLAAVRMMCACPRIHVQPSRAVCNPHPSPDISFSSWAVHSFLPSSQGFCLLCASVSPTANSREFPLLRAERGSSRYPFSISQATSSTCPMTTSRPVRRSSAG